MLKWRDGQREICMLKFLVMDKGAYFTEYLSFYGEKWVKIVAGLCNLCSREEGYCGRNRV